MEKRLSGRRGRTGRHRQGFTGFPTVGADQIREPSAPFGPSGDSFRGYCPRISVWFVAIAFKHFGRKTNQYGGAKGEAGGSALGEC
jgi:hypothetical protein